MPMRSYAVQAKSILPASVNDVARFESWFKTRYWENHRVCLSLNLAGYAESGNEDSLPDFVPVGKTRFQMGISSPILYAYYP